MTDKQKIERFFDYWDVPFEASPKTLTAAGRRFFFTPDGEIEKIKDYIAMESYTP